MKRGEDDVRLLARFSFSFIALGVVLMYLALLADDRATRPAWHGSLMLVGAAACVLVGLLGVQHRHRGR